MIMITCFTWFSEMIAGVPCSRIYKVCIAGSLLSIGNLFAMHGLVSGLWFGLALLVLGLTYMF